MQRFRIYPMYVAYGRFDLAHQVTTHWFVLPDGRQHAYSEFVAAFNNEDDARMYVLMHGVEVK